MSNPDTLCFVEDESKTPSNLLKVIAERSRLSAAENVTATVQPQISTTTQQVTNPEATTPSVSAPQVTTSQVTTPSTGPPTATPAITPTDQVQNDILENYRDGILVYQCMSKL